MKFSSNVRKAFGNLAVDDEARQDVMDLLTLIERVVSRQSRKDVKSLDAETAEPMVAAIFLMCSVFAK